MRFLRWLGHELREALAPTLFFLAVFHTLALTRVLLMQSEGFTPTRVTAATVGALVMAKAVLVAEALPFTHRHAGRPLLLSVTWKTLIYSALGMLFRALEELLPAWIHQGDLGAAWKHLGEHFSWPHFWALQIWFTAAVLLWVTLTEIDRHFGPGCLKAAFLKGGRPADGPVRSGRD